MFYSYISYRQPSSITLCLIINKWLFCKTNIHYLHFSFINITDLTFNQPKPIFLHTSREVCAQKSTLWIIKFTDSWMPSCQLSIMRDYYSNRKENISWELQSEHIFTYSISICTAGHIIYLQFLVVPKLSLKV